MHVQVHVVYLFRETINSTSSIILGQNCQLALDRSAANIAPLTLSAYIHSYRFPIGLCHSSNTCARVRACMCVFVCNYAWSLRSCVPTSTRANQHDAICCACNTQAAAYTRVCAHRYIRSVKSPHVLSWTSAAHEMTWVAIMCKSAQTIFRHTWHVQAHSRYTTCMRDMLNRHTVRADPLFNVNT